MFFLTKDKIDSNAQAESMHDLGAGALVSFEGRVRNNNDGKEVLWLEYEVFEELALAEGNRIVEELIGNCGLIGAKAIHRSGSLQLGDVAVWVGVLAAHRAEAFDGCRRIIDELKHRLPIWKKEFYVDGTSVWVNCAACEQSSTHQSKQHAHAGDYP